MNKPIWIACASKEIEEDVFGIFRATCPAHIKGLSKIEGIEKCYDGDVPNGSTKCREHWKQFVEFMGEDEGETDADD